MRNVANLVEMVGNTLTPRGITTEFEDITFAAPVEFATTSPFAVLDFGGEANRRLT